MYGSDSIDLNLVLAGRKEEKSFHWFLDEIASVVVGSHIVEQVKSVELPSEWLTPSLEAFCLLCVENYFHMIQSKIQKDNSVRAKWTADGRGSKKNQGWKQEGIQRYNELLKQVRKKEERMKYECEKLRKRQEAGIVGRQRLLAAGDDFSSDSDCS